MPELPEVETTLRGISPHMIDQEIGKVIVRESRLRWPVPDRLPSLLRNQTVRELRRRGKYLIISFDKGHMLIHLGMSGSLRLVEKDALARKHDHIDWIMDKSILRFHDPRRFGSALWTEKDPLQHPLLAKLGPEPLSSQFSGEYLHAKSRNRKTTIKNFIMNAQIVVGVGNIYASETLFMAGIHPGRAAGNVSLQRYKRLATAIKKTLAAAIKQGGTTLRDFVNERGNPGYFQQRLNVYAKANEPCPCCSHPIKSKIIGQRSSFFCSHCQR